MSRETTAMLRALSATMEAPYEPRPRFVAIRQTKLAIDARDAVYGGKTRPLGRKLRLTWTRLVGWYVRCRALRYCDVLAIARGLGSDLREVRMELRPGEEAFDAAVRRELSRRLTDAARRNPTTSEDRETYSRELIEARITAHSKQALLDGYCPHCFEPVPCLSCDVPAVALDGRGGLVARSPTL